MKSNNKIQVDIMMRIVCGSVIMVIAAVWFSI